jgi:hypothetical protein
VPGLVCDDVVTGADCIGVLATGVGAGVDRGAAVVAAGVLAGADPEGTGSAALGAGVAGLALA